MEDNILALEYVDVNKLHFYENNPRKNDPAVSKMVKSIKEFGFKIPVLACEDGTLVDGHLRLKAAIKMGLQKIPVIYTTGMTEAQIRAFRIAVNRSVDWADWDIDKLSIELKSLLDFDYDLSLTGFDSAEIDQLLLEATEHNEDIVDIDTSLMENGQAQETRVSSNEIYRLGEHILVCGDATDETVVKSLMSNDLADLWLTDPPYNVGYTGFTADHLTIQNDNMGDESFFAFLSKLYKAADMVLKPGASFYIWYADAQTLPFRMAATDVGWSIRQGLIWAKNHFVLGRQDYQWKHEPCLYGWKGGAPHNWYSDHSQTTILDFKKPLKNIEHPTKKPVELFEYLICNSSKIGDIVLDSCCGSGTTVIACESTKRKARVIEIDPIYASVIVKRWEEYTGETAELIGQVGHL